MFGHFALTEVWPRQADTASRLASRASKVMMVCLVVLWNGQLLAETDDQLSKEYSVCMDKAGGMTGDMIACNGEELDRQDARLNNAYKKLMSSKLSRDRKKALLKAQRAWIKFREANCDYYTDPHGGWGARWNVSECLLTMTATRAKDLEGMVDALD